MIDTFTCPDCELPLALQSDSLCPSCAAWRAQRYRQMDEEYADQQARLARRRMTPGQRFGEALADMAKIVQKTRSNS